MNTHNNYIGIDLAKIVMAIFVVAIHVSPERICSSELVRSSFRVVYDIAVPFFYMASGFLLFRKVIFPFWQTTDGRERVWNYLKKIFRLYVAWTLIYLPLTIYGFVHDQIPVGKAVVIFIRNFLLVGENFYSWPLWYLLGLLVAIVLITLLDKIGCSLKQIVVFSLCIAGIGMLSDYWCDTKIGELYFAVFTKVRNGIFVGFACTALGVWVTQHKLKWSPIMLLSAAMVMLLIAMFYSSFAFTLAATYFLFQWVLGLQFNSLSPIVGSFWRAESTVLYFTHMIVLGFYHFVLLGNSSNTLAVYVGICSICLFIGFILIRYYSESKLFKLLFN